MNGKESDLEKEKRDLRREVSKKQLPKLNFIFKINKKIPKKNYFFFIQLCYKKIFTKIFLYFAHLIHIII